MSDAKEFTPDQSQGMGYWCGVHQIEGIRGTSRKARTNNNINIKDIASKSYTRYQTEVILVFWSLCTPFHDFGGACGKSAEKRPLAPEFC